MDCQAFQKYREKKRGEHIQRTEQGREGEIRERRDTEM